MLLICLVIFHSSSACIQSTVDDGQRRQAQACTALVIHPKSGEALGSAFCVDTAGYFITTHLVTQRSANGNLILMLNPGGRKERKFTARVVRADAETDLALLLTEKPTGKALPLGDDDSLYETKALVAYGYSFGKADAAVADQRATIAVHAARITSLPRESGKLRHIEMDTGLNPGNAGGPLLDADGRVVGVIASGVRSAGLYLATPVTDIRALFTKPLLRAAFPTTVPWSDRYKPVTLKASVDVLSADMSPGKLVLRLNDGRGERKLTAVKSGADYVFKTPLLQNQEPSKVVLHATLSSGALTSLAKDTFLGDGSSKHRLSELRSYEKGVGFQSLDGKSVPMKAEHDTLTLYIAEKPIDVPIREMTSFKVEPRRAESAIVVYRLSFETNGVESASMGGEIGFNEVPDREKATDPTPLIVQAHKAFSGTIERPLSGMITEVTPAGSGRYLLLRMEQPNLLAVYDVGTLEVVKTLPLSDPKTLVAGGASTFVLALPEQKILQRWNLRTFACELTRNLPSEGDLISIGMGPGSEGPLMVQTRPESYRIDFLDLKTFEPIPHLADVSTRNRGRKMGHRYSADGRTIGLWSLAQTGGIEVLTLSDTAPKRRFTPTIASYIAPGPNGDHIYTKAGIFGPDAVKAAASPEQYLLLPTTQPAYCLGAARTTKDPHTARSIRLSLFVTDSSRPVIKLPETPEVKVNHLGYATHNLTIDRMVHFVPQARVLVTIPFEGDRIIARYVDLEALLKESGSEYFFVDSSPEKRAARGTRYRYRVHVESKDPKIEYLLADGPAGMEINPQGLISWHVPVMGARKVPVVVNIRDGEGRERFHAFTIEVVP